MQAALSWTVPEPWDATAFLGIYYDNQILSDYRECHHEERGASENFNKELKNDFDAGVLSHESFDANDFEFLLKSFAYNIYHIFQSEILEKDDRKMMMNTYRLRYQKIAVKVIHHARQFCLSFSTAYKHKDTFLRYWNRVSLLS